MDKRIEKLLARFRVENGKKFSLKEHDPADTAGLDIDALHSIGDGECDAPGGWCLAELNAGGAHYVLRAFQCPSEPEMVRVRAEPRTPDWE